jgi:hypothetical protein
MNRDPDRRYRVGEMRPSQLLFAFGIGSVIDLPHISTMVMGLEDWDVTRTTEIREERLLAAVRIHLGPQLRELRTPPLPKEEDDTSWKPNFEDMLVGIPVAPFPRWLVCTYCRLLAPIGSGLFRLKADVYRPDRTAYVHENCSRPGRPPTAVPARFLVCCGRGHIDDFPWSRFVHRGDAPHKARLRLRDQGPSGEAADVWVACDTCKSRRPMSDAFGPDYSFEPCSGRRPHLRDFETDQCDREVKPILLGASSSWFPEVVSALAIPTATNRLAQLVDDHWTDLEMAQSLQNVELLRHVGKLLDFSGFSDDELWAAIEAKRATGVAGSDGKVRLRSQEWDVLSRPDEAPSGPDFRLARTSVPPRFADAIAAVVLAERLREVNAFIGFTRLESPGDLAESPDELSDIRVPISRQPPKWVPAVEVHGEGVFIRFDEVALSRWEHSSRAVRQILASFNDAHVEWCRARDISDGAISIPRPSLHSSPLLLARPHAAACTGLRIHHREHS